MDGCDALDISSDNAESSLVSDTMSDLFCDPCQEEGNNIQAEGYCVDCTHHLCGICFGRHRRPKPWRHHHLLDKQFMPKSKTDKVYKDECNDYCATHGEEIMRYFCENHKSVGCIICVTLGHRACNVEYIPTLSMDFCDSKEYKAFKRDLDSLVRTTGTLKEAATRNLEYIGQHAERAKDKIRKLRKEIDTFFDGLELDISDRVSKIQNEDQDKIEAIFKQCEALAGTIENLEADINDKESKNQKCRLFVDVKELQNTLEKYKNDISTMEKTNTVRDLTFRPSETISNFISDQSIEFGSLVDFCQTVLALTISPNDILNDMTSNAVLSGRKVDAINDCIGAMDNIDLQEKVKNVIWIGAESDVDIAFLCDGEIKVYPETSQFKLINKHGTSPFELGFVATKHSFIAVTRLTQSVDCMEEIPQSNPLLKNINGDIENIFSSTIALELCDNYDYIAANPNKTAFYVIDSDKKTVTCLTVGSEVKSQYKYSTKWSPSGIVVSVEGLVYVCDDYGDKIHILTSDLKEVGQIDGEKYNMRGPKGVGYCSKEHKLYVGMGESHLRVFNI